MANVTSVQQVLAAYGIEYNSDDPFAGYYQIVAARNIPPSWSGGDSPQQVMNFIEADLRARAILQKCGTNLCGASNNGVTVAGNGVNAKNVALEINGIQTGATVANFFTFGLAGAILGPLEQEIQQKAQLAAQEDQVLGQVAAAFNQTIPKLDYAVQTGAVTVGDAVANLQSVVNQLIAKIETLEQKVCDASCEFVSELKAHLDFAANIFYPGIAPGGTETSPVGVPATTLAPVGYSTVTPVANGTGASYTAVSTTPLSTVPVTAAPSIFFSPATLLLLLLGIFVAFFALRG